MVINKRVRSLFFLVVALFLFDALAQASSFEERANKPKVKNKLEGLSKCDTASEISVKTNNDGASYYKAIEKRATILVGAAKDILFKGDAVKEKSLATCQLPK